MDGGVYTVEKHEEHKMLVQHVSLDVRVKVLGQLGIVVGARVMVS